MVEKYTLLKNPGKVPSALLHFYCMFVVVVSFGIFYYDDFARMTSFFHVLCGGAATIFDGVSKAAILDHFWLWVAAIVLCMPVRQQVAQYFDQCTSGVPVILIGHITKEGTLAGPKILEHIVDTVIQFEGDQHYMYRILRSIKNRFGSTAELGIYEMQQNGLRQVSNPSELLLTQDHEGLSGIAISSAIEGVRPFLVETQALVSTAAYGTPQRSATGFDQRRLNMLLAVLEKRVGFKLMQKDVFINIAGGLRVTDLAMDLSIIAAVLSSNVDTPIENGWCMCGEVGLSGEVRPVNRIEQRIAEAEKLGFSDMIVPKYNMQGFDAKKYRIRLHPVRKVEEALRALFG